MSKLVLAGSPVLSAGGDIENRGGCFFDVILFIYSECTKSCCPGDATNKKSKESSNFFHPSNAPSLITQKLSLI